jgi:hypothetical protein
MPVFAGILDFSIDCPVCNDDWFPTPLKLFISEEDDQEKNIAEKVIFWQIQNNFEDDLETIQNCDNRISISTLSYKGDKNKLFAKLLEIRSERIVSLKILFSNYSLTEENMNWLLSLTNLEHLFIEVKKFPADLPSKLIRLKKLRYIRYISDGTKESTRNFMSGISQHTALEHLKLCNMHFTKDVSWQLPAKIRTIDLDSCLLTLPLIEKIGSAVSVRHIVIFNSKFSETDFEIKTDSLFHSQIRCLEIHDKKLSRYILDNIDKLPKLKMFAMYVDQKDITFVKSRICNTKNIIRALLFFNEPAIRTKIWDDFIKDIRFNHAIYVDYYSVWYNYRANYEQFMERKISISISEIDFLNKVKTNKIIQLN